MAKFGRIYRLEVQIQENGPYLVVEPPLTIDFDAYRNLIVSPNVSTIKIYNLSPTHRNQLRFDRSNFGQIRNVILKAGYENQLLATVFSGNVVEAWSVREGTEFITTISAHDGGFSFVNGTTSATFPAGTTQTTILKTIAVNLPGVSLGAFGNYTDVLQRGNSYNGNSMDLLTQLTGGGAFIDNGKINCLQNSECVFGGIPIINSASGLLGTPVRENLIVHFDMIFEPRLLVGQQVELQSIGEGNFNGFYKIYSLHHKGMISESVCGSAVTSVIFNYGAGPLMPVKSVT